MSTQITSKPGSPAKQARLSWLPGRAKADLVRAKAGPVRAKADPVQAKAGPDQPADRALRSVGIALTLLAVVILGFVGYLYGLSGIQEERSQTNLYGRLRGELSQAVAPTGPVIPGHPANPASLAAVPGDPIAILTIPAIGITRVLPRRPQRAGRDRGGGRHRAAVRGPA